VVGDKVGARYIGRCGEMNLDAQIDYLPRKRAANEVAGGSVSGCNRVPWSAKSRSAPAADEVQMRAATGETR
jgi:hypothetical protein